MSTTDAVGGSYYLSGAGALKRFLPEPQSNAGVQIGNFLKALSSTALQGAGGLSGMDSQYQEIIQKQIELQEQMMLVSMLSNLERTKHETRMSAVRNFRVA